MSVINLRSNGCLFTKSNFLDSYLLSAHVFPLVFLSVFPIDADSGEDQNNRQKSVRRGWHQAVSRGWGQDRLLQSTGELTAAAITTDSHTDRTHPAQLLSHSAFHFASTAFPNSTPVPRYRVPTCHSEQNYKDSGWNFPLWNASTLQDPHTSSIVVCLCLSKQTQVDIYNMTSTILVISLVLLGKSWYYHTAICSLSDTDRKALTLAICSQPQRHASKCRTVMRKSAVTVLR